MLPTLTADQIAAFTLPDLISAIQLRWMKWKDEGDDLLKRRYMVEMALISKELKKHNFTVRFHPHVLHIFPSTSIELLKFKGRMCSLYSLPLKTFKLHILLHQRFKLVEAASSKERKAVEDALKLLRERMEIDERKEGD